MNLDFSDDQKLLQEEAKKFLTKEDALKKIEQLWIVIKLMTKTFGIRL